MPSFPVRHGLLHRSRATVSLAARLPAMAKCCRSHPIAPGLGQPSLGMRCLISQILPCLPKCAGAPNIGLAGRRGRAVLAERKPGCWCAAGLGAAGASASVAS